MFAKKRAGIVLALAIIVVGGASVGLLYRIGAMQPKGPSYDLLSLAKKDGFALPRDLVKSAWTGSFGHFARGNVAFRQWLVKLVERPNENPEVRREASGALTFLDDDRQVDSVMEEILQWLETTPPAGGEDESVRFTVRNNILLRVLMTDLPDEEVLNIMKRARPDFWRTCIERNAEVRLDQPHGMDEKVLRHMKARAEGLLKYLEATEGGPPHQASSAASGAAQQPKPEPGVP